MIMSLSRRDFLKSTGLVALGATVPSFVARTARAAGFAGVPGVKDTILVVVQLTGGNDGLNTVIPFTDPLYAQYRPTIKIAKDQVKKINDAIGLHPAMDSLAKLLEQNALCVVQGVGYPNPSQSHFRSMEIWQAGSTDQSLTEGWLGKALKSATAPAFHIAEDKETSPLALAGATARVPSIHSLEDFQLKFAAANSSDQKAQRTVVEGAAK